MKIIGIISIMFLISNVCYAQPVSSSELINNAKQYDGKKIIYSGEVIGEIMRRGEYAWINTSDGINAIGIWAGKDLLKDIVYVGSYKARGDFIEVEGIFNRSCRQHGGDLDIHAESIRKIEEGYNINEKINLQKIRMSVWSGIILLLLLILKVFSIKFRKRKQSN